NVPSSSGLDTVQKTVLSESKLDAWRARFGRIVGTEDQSRSDGFQVVLAELPRVVVRYIQESVVTYRNVPEHGAQVGQAGNRLRGQGARGRGPADSAQLGVLHEVVVAVVPGAAVDIAGQLRLPEK